MRIFLDELALGCTPIEAIPLDVKSRDDIPAILIGLQAIYRNESTRARLKQLLEEQLLPDVRHDTGRPGMCLWEILVLGVLQVGLNCDFDRLEYLAKNAKDLRQMLGLSPVMDEEITFDRQTLIDNVSLLTPSILRQVNDLVVETGHEVVRKKPGAPLHGRVDSFVAKTDVRHPTDVSLLFDAIRTALSETVVLCDRYQLAGWRQHGYWHKQLKQSFQSVRNSQRWSKPKRIKPYLKFCADLLERLQTSRACLSLEARTELLDQRLSQAHLLWDQVQRRLIQGEKIPASEKIYSVFKPYSRWIAKGKAKAPVELGVPVTILAEEHGFVLGCEIQWQGGDTDAAVPLVEACQDKYPTLKACSFDRGFHSPSNREQLDECLTINALPRKGSRPNAAERAREEAPAFQAMRRWHSGVESAIHHLGCHGMERIRTHGAEGFERTVLLAMVAANLHRLGMHIRNAQLPKPKKRSGRGVKRKPPLPLAA